jgi:polar amino acid transport system permease protein
LRVKPRNDGEAEELLLPAGSSLRVGLGTVVYFGDVVAMVPYSKPGILLEGLWITMEVSAFAIVLGIALGLLTGLCRLADNPALRWGAVTYIELIRGSPLLVQIFLWYFVAGYLIDGLLQRIGMPPLPQLWYGVIALAVFTGAYVAEIVRAGIQSIGRGQMEAARSLGMTHAQAMRKVVLPQAFRRILPPLAGQFISLIKDSSLLGVMAVRELTKATREAVTSSLQSLELWFTCAILYLVLTFTLSLFVQYLERRAVLR